MLDHHLRRESSSAAADKPSATSDMATALRAITRVRRFRISCARYFRSTSNSGSICLTHQPQQVGSAPRQVRHSSSDKTDRLRQQTAAFTGRR